MQASSLCVRFDRSLISTKCAWALKTCKSVTSSDFESSNKIKDNTRLFRFISEDKYFGDADDSA